MPEFLFKFSVADFGLENISDAENGMRIPIAKAVNQ